LNNNGGDKMLNNENINQLYNKLLLVECSIDKCDNLAISKGLCFKHAKMDEELIKDRKKINKLVNEYRKKIKEEMKFDEKYALLFEHRRIYNILNHKFKNGGGVFDFKKNRQGIKSNNKSRRYNGVQRFRQERELLF
jgi:hypothetical protein